MSCLQSDVPFSSSSYAKYSTRVSFAVATTRGLSHEHVTFLSAVVYSENAAGTMMMLGAQIRQGDSNGELTDSIPSSEITGSFRWKTSFR